MQAERYRGLYVIEMSVLRELCEGNVFFAQVFDCGIQCAGNRANQ